MILPYSSAKLHFGSVDEDLLWAKMVVASFDDILLSYHAQQNPSGSCLRTSCCLPRGMSINQKLVQRTIPLQAYSCPAEQCWNAEHAYPLAGCWCR